jgi:hypothetical protein
MSGLPPDWASAVNLARNMIDCGGNAITPKGVLSLAQAIVEMDDICRAAIAAPPAEAQPVAYLYRTACGLESFCYAHERDCDAPGMHIPLYLHPPAPPAEAQEICAYRYSLDDGKTWHVTTKNPADWIADEDGIVIPLVALAGTKDV